MNRAVHTAVPLAATLRVISDTVVVVAVVGARHAGFILTLCTFICEAGCCAVNAVKTAEAAAAAVVAVTAHGVETRMTVMVVVVVGEAGAAVCELVIHRRCKRSCRLR